MVEACGSHRGATAAGQVPPLQRQESRLTLIAKSGNPVVPAAPSVQSVETAVAHHLPSGTVGLHIDGLSR